MHDVAKVQLLESTAYSYKVSFPHLHVGTCRRRFVAQFMTVIIGYVRRSDLCVPARALLQ
jgi:hypothetical protein